MNVNVNEIEKGAYEGRVAEVNDAFEYAKKIALEALERGRVQSMSFTIVFDEGYVPTVNHDITEHYF